MGKPYSMDLRERVRSGDREWWVAASSGSSLRCEPELCGEAD